VPVKVLPTALLRLLLLLGWRALSPAALADIDPLNERPHIALWLFGALCSLHSSMQSCSESSMSQQKKLCK
jgi:hypothetical protein